MDSCGVSLLKLQDDRQISAFIVMLVMFGDVVLGLWVESVFMLGLGLIVTALTLAGYLLFTQTFNLWMALAGGGSVCQRPLHALEMEVSRGTKDLMKSSIS